jgi:solute carrier family 35, member F1/2
MSNIRSDAPFIVDEKSSINFVPPVLPSDRAVARPPIDYSSFGGFWHSIWRRFLSLWTRQFVLSLLSGQVVSLCITCTNVTTEELTTGNWQLPTTQTFFLYPFFFFFSASTLILTGLFSRYFSIFIIYTPYTIYQCMLSPLSIWRCSLTLCR